MAIFSTNQYPRRSEYEELWNTVYLLMYGVLGTCAQYGGIVVSTTSERKNPYKEANSWKMWARLYASLHFVIGVHHLLWSLHPNHAYRKLELWRYELPFIYELTALTALGYIYHAYRIFIATDLSIACSHKTVLDCCTCATFVSFVYFWGTNVVRIETSFETERLWWALTMYLAPVVW